MLKVIAEPDQVRIGKRFAVSFQRTLRVPDDGKSYPLPPGLAPFPIYRVADYLDRVPASWKKRGGVFIPMYQREALWLGFSGAYWKPNAVKVGVGEVNAISGEAWDEALHAKPQDYIVCPDQPWLDGINAGSGFIRQFVAMPLGLGYSVEAQVTGSEQTGGIQIVVYEPKPGKFPDQPPPSRQEGLESVGYATGSEAAGEMGIAAGGKIQQKIYPDRYGIDTWDPDNRGSLFIHIVNSEQFKALTGRDPPATPISARTYTESGLPWFELYDEAAGDVAGADALSQVKSVAETDASRGAPQQADDASIDVPEGQVEKLPRRATGKHRDASEDHPRR